MRSSTRVSRHSEIRGMVERSTGAPGVGVTVLVGVIVAVLMLLFLRVGCQR